MAQSVLSAKLPDELIDALGRTAIEQEMTRNRLVREALEAIVDGRVIPLTADEELSRDLRAGLKREEDTFARLLAEELDRAAMLYADRSGPIA